MNKKRVLNYLSITLIIVITIIFLQSDFGNISSLAENVNPLWAACSVVAIAACFLFDGLAFNCVSRMFHEGGVLRSIKTIMIGYYHMSITPISSGGPPSYLYTMSQDNVSVGKSSSIMAVKFIINELVYVTFLIIFFIYNLDYLREEVGGAIPLIIIGMLIFISASAAVIATFQSPESFRKGINWIYGKVRGVIGEERSKKWDEKIQKAIEDYISGAKSIRKNARLFAEACVFNTLKWISYFSIVCFVYLSLGQEGTSLIRVASLQPLLDVAISFIPVPGKVGVAETTFYLFFRPIFDQESIGHATVMWRSITYYLKVLSCGLVSLLNRWRS